MKNLLFPRGFQVAGWMLFIPAVTMGMLLCVLRLVDMPGILETIVNDVVIIGIVTGALFIVCSKERQEDEMTASIRLNALLNALYIYASLLIINTVLLNGLLYFQFMIINLVLLPVIYVIVFRIEMHRYSKMGEDEE